jgi:dipeptide/tripeptide permease
MMMEVMDELSYYGTVGTFVLYLEGAYPPHFWSAGMTTVQAGQLVSTSVAVMFTTPFIMAIIADSVIGNYLTILISSLCLYIPGLLLIALTAYPYLLGNTFPTGVLTTAMLGLIPLGSGGIRACVNVLGAQQFHPALQRRQLESYYVNFYLTVNIGALIGGIVIPIVLRYSAFSGYMLSTCCFFLAVFAFVVGNHLHNYIKMKPQGKDNLTVLTILGKMICSLQGLERQKVSCGGHYSDVLVQSIKKLGAVIPVTMLIMPFNIAFGQIISMFVVQGAVMADAGFVDAAWMQNFNPLAIIVLGALISGKLYPYLEKSNKTLDISSKFMIGTIFAALAILWATLVDFMIISKYAKTGQAINILWQAPSYFLIGAGEIFAISSAYEAAFIIAPKNLKALASAINIFLIGGLPKFINTGLVSACSIFFTNADGNQDISTLSRYATAHVWKYFLLLVGIELFGVLINALPVTRRFLTRTLDGAEHDIDTSMAIPT